MNWVQTPRVLVLDDERVIADTLSQILKVNGCDATAVYSADTALGYLDDPPDLLITDVALDPDSINGIDVALYFRQSCLDCEVLLISGHAGTTDLLQNAQSRGHEFRLLHKPVHPDELLDAVAQQLEDLLEHSEPLKDAS